MSAAGVGAGSQGAGGGSAAGADAGSASAGGSSAGLGREMYALVEELFPICRSITGDGVRQTLDILRRHIPLEVREVPTGTKVFDWEIPQEWNIRAARIVGPDGSAVADFAESNLSVVGYSVPFAGRVSLAELKEHLFTLPERPDVIPYRTSYYRERWGFCMRHAVAERLPDGDYDVLVDSDLSDGSLTYGELLVEGETTDEVLLSSYTCHPSLANDSLSGVALLTLLARSLLAGPTPRYSYRFLFIPETIGAIAWLAANEDGVARIRHGLVCTCVGDSGAMTYKRSRDGDAPIDRIVQRVLKARGQPYSVVDFDPSDGSDERQFSSPGFALPVGSLMRTQYARFAEYHTSADDLDFIDAEHLEDSLDAYLAVVSAIENECRYLALSPKGEPRLGPRGVYRTTGDDTMSVDEAPIFWVLNFSDGQHSLLDIAARSGLEYERVVAAADRLESVGLLQRIQ